MAGLDVIIGDKLLTAEWQLDGSEVFGEYVVCTIAPGKSSVYTNIPITADELVGPVGTKVTKQFPTLNGDINHISVVTYDRDRKQKRVLSKRNNVSKGKPEKVQFDLLQFDKLISIKLKNYFKGKKPDFDSGHGTISSFEVIIDKVGDDESIEDSFLSVPVDLLVNDSIDIKTFKSENLVNDTTYRFTIRALNEVGLGAISETKGIAPSEKPSVPTDFRATAKNGEVDLVWTPGPEIFDYEYILSIKPRLSNDWVRLDKLSKIRTITITQDGQQVSVDEKRNSYTAKGLKNGDRVDFKLIVSSLEKGDSQEALIQDVTPFTFPSIMDDTHVTFSDLSNNAIRVSLKPPLNNGKEIVGYYFARSGAPDNNFAASAVLNQNKEVTFNVADLPIGEPISFLINAKNTNEANTLANTYIKSITQYQNPAAVIDLSVKNISSVVSNNAVGKAELKWKLPENLGGVLPRELTHSIKYRGWSIKEGQTEFSQDVSDDTIISVVGETSFDVSNLVLGKQHVFSIQNKFNRNNVDFLSANSSSVSVIPTCPPEPPIPSIEVVDGVVKFKFSKPSLYGSPLKTYRYKFVNSSQVADKVDYSDIAILEGTFTPQNDKYGLVHKLYIKTVTQSEGAELKSLVHVSNDFTPYKAPNEVSSLDVYASESSLEAQWGAPSDLGGYTAIKYIVTVDGGMPMPAISAKRAKISGLKNETYYIRVQAVGYIGEQAGLVGKERIASGMPYNDPEPPTDFKVTPGDVMNKLTWKPSATAASSDAVGTDKPDIKYIIFKDDKLIHANGVNELEFTDSMLTNGRLYNYRIVTRQKFSDGKITYSDNFTSEQTSQSATPFGAPDKPSFIESVASDKGLTLRWGEPASWNGNPEDERGYVILLYERSGPNKDGEFKTGENFLKRVFTSDKTISFSNLTNGKEIKYIVTSRALNPSPNLLQPFYSESTMRQEGTIKPNVTPLAPKDLSVVAGDQESTLFWSHPTDDYGNSVNYEVIKNNVKQGNVTVDVLGNGKFSAKVSGLVNGVKLSLGVQRIIIGSNEKSDIAKLDVTPFGLPLFDSVRLVDNNHQVELKVNPNGASLKRLILIAVPGFGGYSPNNVLLNEDAIELSQLTGLVTLKTTKLSVPSISGVYAVVVNDKGGVLSQQANFP